MATLRACGENYDWWQAGDMPRKITPELKNSANHALLIVEENLLIANENDIKAAVYTLLKHYYVEKLSETAHQAIATDWLEDLQEFPAWAIEYARKKWRQNNKKKPTPGHIVELCRKAVSKDRAMKWQCQKIIDAPITKEPEPELSPEEREAMKKRISDIVKAARKKI